HTFSALVGDAVRQRTSGHRSLAQHHVGLRLGLSPEADAVWEQVSHGHCVLGRVLHQAGQTDPAYTAAVQRAGELGLARGGFVPDIARHIEIKEAATMAAGEIRTIVIGKDPCGIDPVTNVSCHRFLRYFLPPGATLVVYGPRGEPYRYEGKRTQ